MDNKESGEFHRSDCYAYFITTLYCWSTNCPQLV